MAKDFVPMADADLHAWLNAFKQNIENNGTNIGLSPAQVANTSQLCLEYINQIEQANQLKAASQAATTKKRKMRTTHLQPIRKMIKLIKAQPTYGKSTGAGIRVLSHEVVVDEHTYKAAFKVRRTGERIELRFKKKGIDAMEFSVYINDGERIDLGVKMHSPVHFRPVGFPVGSILKCKFYAFGIKNDNRIGEQSNEVPFLYEVLYTVD